MRKISKKSLRELSERMIVISKLESSRIVGGVGNSFDREQPLSFELNNVVEGMMEKLYEGNSAIEYGPIYSIPEIVVYGEHQYKDAGVHDIYSILSNKSVDVYAFLLGLHPNVIAQGSSTVISGISLFSSDPREKLYKYMQDNNLLSVKYRVEDSNYYQKSISIGGSPSAMKNVRGEWTKYIFVNPETKEVILEVSKHYTL